MSINKINHYTMNTQNNRVSNPEEVNKELYFKLKSIFKDAQTKNGADLLDNTNVILTIDDDCYIATLRYKKKNEYIPVLVTAGTANKDSRMWLWKHMTSTMQDITGAKGNTFQMPPDAPFILDMLIPVLVNPKIYKWTGDFTRCLGWMMLSPKSILNN